MFGDVQRGNDKQFAKKWLKDEIFTTICERVLPESMVRLCTKKLVFKE